MWETTYHFSLIVSLAAYPNSNLHGTAARIYHDEPNA